MSKRLINKNLIANSLNQALGIGFPVLIQYYLIRHLRLEDLGYWNIINSSRTIVLLFIGFFNIYLIKKLAETNNRDVQGSYLTNTILIMYLVLVMPVVVFLAYMYVKYPFLKDYVLISTISIITTPLALEFYFQATLKNTYLLYRRLISRVLYLGALFLFVKDESDFMSYAYLATFSLVFEHLLNLWFIKDFIKIKNISRKVAKQIFFKSIKYLPFRVSYNILPHFSIIAGAYFLSIRELAIYSVLFKLINLATTFISSSVMVLFPVKVKASAESEEKRFLDLKYLRNTALVSVLVILGLFVTRELVFFIFLDDHDMSNMSLEFGLLSVYILIHSVYNYLAYNFHLVKEKSKLLTLLNGLILIIFLGEIGLSKLLNFDLSFAISVLVPSGVALTILWIKTQDQLFPRSGINIA